MKVNNITRPPVNMIGVAILVVAKKTVEKERKKGKKPTMSNNISSRTSSSVLLILTILHDDERSPPFTRRPPVDSLECLISGEYCSFEPKCCKRNWQILYLEEILITSPLFSFHKLNVFHRTKKRRYKCNEFFSIKGN